MNTANPIIAVANQKGGVAKTTTAISIAHLLARLDAGAVTLLDLDQQGQCAIGLGLSPRSAVFDFLVGDASLANCLVDTTRANLDLLPGNARTKHVDFVYRNEIDGFDILTDRLRSIAIHAAVVIDTPTAGLLQEAAIRIADVVVIPARCETLSVDSVHATLGMAARLNPSARVIILPTMYDKRLGEHAYNFGILQKLDDPTLTVAVASPIPARVAVLEAAARGLTIWEHSDIALTPVRDAYSSLLDLIFDKTNTNPTGAHQQ